MTDNKTVLNEQIRQLPESPGVYLMRDAAGDILYVGKASSLRNRVSSYFTSQHSLSPKTQQLVSKIHDIDFYIVSSEQEALILELNLVKQHSPQYNVRLKDDKSYPYLKITTNEEWPCISVTRRPTQDRERYFGPFANAKSVRHTLNIIKHIFPVRTCTKDINGKDTRPCLLYYIGNCLAPCTDAVSQREYRRLVKEVILFLEGKQEKIVRNLKKRMENAAEVLDFEKAASIRDQLQAIEEVIEGQRIAARVKGEQDVIAIASNKDFAYAQVFFIRNGKLIGREYFILQGTHSEEPEQIITSFVKQFYDSSTYIPPQLLIQYPIEDMEIIRNWLNSKRGGKVNIQVPSRGSKKQLMDIAIENAQQGMKQYKIKQISSETAVETALEEIKTALDLPDVPSRIEGYDISNMQGAAAVGSMVVFDKGRPKPAHYRRFRIKTVPGIDDYAMIQEVLRRRFKRGSERTTNTSISDTWAILPELILIDGGKGHLNAARKVMKEMEVEYLPTVSLAKENEEIFIPGKSKPYIMPRSSSGLQLLQRVRDEAHRFAITYHKKVRNKSSFASSLDGITGIGPSRKRALIKQFGSVKGIKEASVEEIASIKGMNTGLAIKVKECL